MKYFISILILAVFNGSIYANNTLESLGYQYNETSFISAIEKRDHLAIDEFFKTDLITKKKLNNHHILNLIIERGDLQTFVKFLSHQKVIEKVKTQDGFYGKLLFFLLGTGEREHAIALCTHFDIKQGATFNDTNLDLLYESVVKEELDVMKCLFDKGANIESASNLNSNVLGASLRNSNLEAFKYLVKRIDLSVKELKFFKGLLRDITFRKQTDKDVALRFLLDETNIQKSEDLYHELYMTLLTHDAEDLITILNKSFDIK